MKRRQVKKQKRRYAKNAQNKTESTQKSESEEQYERLLYMQNAHCRPAVFPRAEHPHIVRRTAPSNTRIKLTAKLKSLKALKASCSLSAAH